VLKGLHALSRLRPAAAEGARAYDNARHLLVGEIAAAMNIPLHVAEDNLDYALWPRGHDRARERRSAGHAGSALACPRPPASMTISGFEDEEVGGAAGKQPPPLPPRPRTRGRRRGGGEARACPP